MSLFSLVKFCKSVWQILQKKRDHRYLVNSLCKMDDASLRDIGLNPADIKEREQICCLKE